MPPDQFIVGGLARQMCRSGAADPNSLDIFELRGLDFERGDFLRDVAALNGWRSLRVGGRGFCLGAGKTRSEN